MLFFSFYNNCISFPQRLWFYKSILSNYQIQVDNWITTNSVAIDEATSLIIRLNPSRRRTPINPSVIQLVLFYPPVYMVSVHDLIWLASGSGKYCHWLPQHLILFGGKNLGFYGNIVSEDVSSGEVPRQRCSVWLHYPARWDMVSHSEPLWATLSHGEPGCRDTSAALQISSLSPISSIFCHRLTSLPDFFKLRSRRSKFLH